MELDVIPPSDRRRSDPHHRTAYLRRTLERERVEAQAPASLDGLERFAALAADLDDSGVMSEAWS